MRTPRNSNLCLFGAVLAACCLVAPASSAPTDAEKAFAKVNAPTIIEQESSPVIAQQSHEQLRFSHDNIAPSDPTCLGGSSNNPLDNLDLGERLRETLRGQAFRGVEDPALQYLPPIIERFRGEEVYAISFKEPLPPHHYRYGQHLAVHPKLPYAAVAIGNAAYIYKTGPKWTRLHTLRERSVHRIEALVFSPDGRWVAFTYRATIEDEAFAEGYYTRIIEFDRLLAFNSAAERADDDVAVLMEAGPLSEVRDRLLEPLNRAFADLAGWSDSELAVAQTASTVQDHLDRAIGQASLRRDVALNRLLGGRLSAGSFSPDSRLIFLRTQFNNVSIYDIDITTGNRSLVRSLSHPPTDGDWSHDNVRWGGPSHSRFSFNFGERIEWIGWSPDGSIIATASRDKTVVLWNPSTGEKLFTLRGATDACTAGRFSPDGSWLAVASTDEKVRVYSTRTGSVLATFDSGSSDVNTMTFNADGTRLAFIVYGWTNAAEVTEVETVSWTQTRTYAVQKEPAKACADGQMCVESFSMSSPERGLYYGRDNVLVFGSRRGISVLGTEEREVLRISARRIGDDVDGSSDDGRQTMVMSPDGKEVWSLDDDDFLRVWKLDQVIEA